MIKLIELNYEEYLKNMKRILCIGVLLVLSLFAREQKEEFEIEREQEEDLEIVKIQIMYGKDKEEDIEIALFTKQYPVTTQNFKNFCVGHIIPKSNEYKSKVDEEIPLAYYGTPFHRIIKGFVLQGGDILYGNGTGSVSSIRENGEPFEDEKDALKKEGKQYIERKHNKEGMLAMANSGKNTNGSQFYITLNKKGPKGWDSFSYLDGKHTVFGRVIKGMNVIRELERLYGRDPNDSYMGISRNPPRIGNITLTGKYATEEMVQSDTIPNYVPEKKDKEEDKENIPPIYEKMAETTKQDL
ncbi:peptidyl-prolyl isomerase D [Nematocida sp. LUAm1]|nr:peptidyl-prolyl isomerase D [Nematocida sp. LUAm2]KAI5177271.1 peptidyl-prolyl isomerase D [Nematocida sp. LUAm1]